MESRQARSVICIDMRVRDIPRAITNLQKMVCNLKEKVADEQAALIVNFDRYSSAILFNNREIVFYYGVPRMMPHTKDVDCSQVGIGMQILKTWKNMEKQEVIQGKNRRN